MTVFPIWAAAGVCSVRRGARSLPQRGGVESPAGRATAKAEGETPCFLFLCFCFNDFFKRMSVTASSIFFLQEQAVLEEAASSQTKKPEACPNSNYRDKYSHLIGTSAAKDAAHTLEANRAYGCGE